MVASEPATPEAAGSRPVAGEACGALFLALQRWILCICRGSHDHVNGGAVSLTLSGKYIKEPLRTTSSLAMTTLSVPISENILRIHAGCRGSVVACATFKREIAGSSRWLGLVVLWRCVPGQDTLSTCALSRPGSKWVLGRTGNVCVLNISSVRRK